jgi:hypothetical protein
MHKKAAWQLACPFYNNSQDRAGADGYHSGMRILHSLSSLALICLATGALWAAEDPECSCEMHGQAFIAATNMKLEGLPVAPLPCRSTPAAHSTA